LHTVYLHGINEGTSKHSLLLPKAPAQGCMFIIHVIG